MPFLTKHVDTSSIIIKPFDYQSEVKAINIPLSSAIIDTGTTNVLSFSDDQLTVSATLVQIDFNVNINPLIQTNICVKSMKNTASGGSSIWRIQWAGPSNPSFSATYRTNMTMFTDTPGIQTIQPGSLWTNFGTITKIRFQNTNVLTTMSWYAFVVGPSNVNNVNITPIYKSIRFPLKFSSTFLTNDADVYLKQLSWSSNHSNLNVSRMQYSVYMFFLDLHDSNQISSNEEAHYCISPKVFSNASLFHVLPDYHLGTMLKSVRYLQCMCEIRMNIEQSQLQPPLNNLIELRDSVISFPKLSISLLLDDNHFT